MSVEREAVVHRRPDILLRRPATSASAAQTSSRASELRGLLDAGDRRADPLAQRGEELALALGDLLLGAEHLRLVLLELGRDVALGVGQRLAPLVVGAAPRPCWRG